MPRIRKVPLPDGTEGDGEVVGFRSSGEHWNEYLLDDGTVLKLKTVVTDVLRVDGHYDRKGNPLYLVDSASILAVDAPDELRWR